MVRKLGLLIVASAAGVALAPGAAVAQRVLEDDPWCDRSWGDRDADRYCEVREFTLPTDRGVIAVDGRANGGITVEGWNRDEISVRAKVQSWSRWDDDARGLASEIDILLDGRTIRASGPRTRRREGWSVSYELMVPTESNLSLETVNGGIKVMGVHGDIEFRATNGGIALDDVGGDVRGRTTNGGIHVELYGDEWDGAGLDVQTTNGGVTLDVPDDYRATLTSGTVNGGLRIDFPIVVQGRINRRQITTDLNGGGTPIRAMTTNGGVTIRRN
jgi:hypothetical protein